MYRIKPSELCSSSENDGEDPVLRELNVLVVGEARAGGVNGRRVPTGEVSWTLLSERIRRLPLL